MRQWLGAVGFFVATAIATSFAASLAHAERVALVIGNDVYPNLPKDQQLAKAVNDARAMGDPWRRSASPSFAGKISTVKP